MLCREKKIIVILVQVPDKERTLAAEVAMYRKLLIQKRFGHRASN